MQAIDSSSPSSSRPPRRLPENSEWKGEAGKLERQATREAERQAWWTIGEDADHRQPLALLLPQDLPVDVVLNPPLRLHWLLVEAGASGYKRNTMAEGSLMNYWKKRRLSTAHCPHPHRCRCRPPFSPEVTQSESGRRNLGSSKAEASAYKRSRDTSWINYWKRRRPSTALCHHPRDLAVDIHHLPFRSHRVQMKGRSSEARKLNCHATGEAETRLVNDWRRRRLLTALCHHSQDLAVDVLRPPFRSHRVQVKGKSWEARKLDRHATGEVGRQA